MDQIQRVLCSIDKVFVFNVPALKGTGGFKAKEWNKTPIWQGGLTVVAKGTTCSIVLRNKDGLFATCPIKSTRTVEQVTDSSRYFVLRITNAKGRSAVIGIGFDQRSYAFDFKASIQDFETQKTAGEQMKKIDNSIKLDYSLPEGAKIQVNLTGKLKAKMEEKKDSDDDDDDSSFTLPAPGERSPGKKKKKQKDKKKKKKKAKKKDKDDSDEEKEPKPTGKVEDIFGFGDMSLDSGSKSKPESSGGSWEQF